MPRVPDLLLERYVLGELSPERMTDVQARLEDEPLIQYLARKAYRDEWLFGPAVALYPERRWSELD